MTSFAPMLTLLPLLLALGSCDGKPPPEAGKSVASAEAPAKAPRTTEVPAKAKPADKTPAQTPPAAKAPPKAEPLPAGAAPPTKGITTANLGRFFPAEIRGAPIKPMGRAFGGTEGFAAAAYRLDDDRGPRFININLQKVKDLDFEKAQFRVKTDGETSEGNGRSLLGRTIGGRFAQRSHSHSMNSSEVIMLIDDAISLRVSVEKARDPDEAFEILPSIDLDGLASIIP